MSGLPCGRNERHAPGIVADVFSKSKTGLCPTTPRLPNVSTACPQGHLRGTSRCSFIQRGEIRMLALAIVLLVLWVLGFAVFHIAGAVIHLLLLAAVVVFLWRFITGRGTMSRV